MLLLLVLLLLRARASSLLPGFSILPLEGSGSFGVWWCCAAAPTEGCFCLRLLVEFLSASFCRSFSFFSLACSSIAMDGGAPADGRGAAGGEDGLRRRAGAL